MDSGEELDGVSATADIGDHLRTWRMFLVKIRWSVAVLGVVLVLLLLMRTHG